MRKLIILIAAAFSIASTAYANLGSTYKWSVRHWGTRGVVVGDHANFSWNGYLITEGYNPSGICDIIMFSHLDGSDLSQGEIIQVMSYQIPAGYIWRRYNGNPVCPTWECNVYGQNWCAMYYTNSGTLNGYPVYRRCLRIGTEAALATRGYLNGPAPVRVARGLVRDIKPAHATKTAARKPATRPVALPPASNYGEI